MELPAVLDVVLRHGGRDAPVAVGIRHEYLGKPNDTLLEVELTRLS